MSNFLSRLGTSSARHWRRTLLIAIVLIAGIGTLGSALGAGFVDDYRTPGVDSTRAQELLEQRFPSVSGADAQLVFAGDPAAVSGDGVKATLRAVDGQPHVTGVSELQVSADGTVAFATVQYDLPAEDLGPDARERLESVTGPAERAGVEVSMRGMAIDIGDEQPAPIGELIGVAAAILLLTLLFRSVVAMTVTLVASAFGLVGGMMLVALASAGVDIPTVAPTIGDDARARRRHRLRAVPHRPPPRAAGGRRRPGDRRGPTPTAPPASPCSRPARSWWWRSAACWPSASRSWAAWAWPRASWSRSPPSPRSP